MGMLSKWWYLTCFTLFCFFCIQRYRIGFLNAHDIHILLFVAGFFFFSPRPFFLLLLLFFMLNLPSSTLSISVQIWGALKLLFPPVIVLDKSSSSYRSEVRVGMLWGMESFTTSQSSSSHKPTCLEINTNAKRETQLSAVVHTFPLKTLSDIFLGCSRKKKNALKRNNNEKTKIQNASFFFFVLLFVNERTIIGCLCREATKMYHTSFSIRVIYRQH